MESMAFFKQWGRIALDGREGVHSGGEENRPAPFQEWLEVQKGWSQLVENLETNESSSKDARRMERRLRRRMHRCWEGIGADVSPQSLCLAASRFRVFPRRLSITAKFYPNGGARHLLRQRRPRCFVGRSGASIPTAAYSNLPTALQAGHTS